MFAGLALSLEVVITSLARMKQDADSARDAIENLGKPDVQGAISNAHSLMAATGRSRVGQGAELMVSAGKTAMDVLNKSYGGDAMTAVRPAQAFEAGRALLASRSR
jgi:hypothetical protein